MKPMLQGAVPELTCGVIVMRVQAYRNLNSGLWSLRYRMPGDKRFTVIAHCERVVLSGVTVRQSEAARQTVIRNGQRSVHCWVEGDLVAVDGVDLKKDVCLPVCNDLIPALSQGVTYNPYEHKTLVYRDDESREYAGGALCVLDSDQKMYVRG